MDLQLANFNLQLLSQLFGSILKMKLQCGGGLQKIFEKLKNI